MGKIIRKNLACLDPNCGSSDARQVYENGTSFCFSCQSFFPRHEADFDESIREPEVIKEISSKKKFNQLDEIKDYPVRGFKERGITKTVCEFYGVKVSYGENGEIDSHYYPYEEDKAYKVRKLPKTFTWIGNSTKLFGQTKFNGAGRKLIITEGEIDALSIAQASFDKYKKFYPIVAMSSATMTKVLIENRDWIRSFAEVVLCFDEDAAGAHAREEAIKIIGIDKAKFTKLPQKDANDVLLKDGANTLLQCIFDAAPYIPSGIITKEELWTALENYNKTPSVPYPACLDGVNSKTKGMRPGEIVLFISGTGSGKSSVLREIMLHVIVTTDDKIGVISLEESPAETARKLSGMMIMKNPAKEEIPIEELKVGFDKVFGDDKIVLLDHQGSISDGSIIDKLEYMCLTGCKYLFIDHITILVSEGVDNLTGNEAQDKIMNDLLRLVKKHNVWIGLVSHLRKTPNTKKAFEEGVLPSLDDIRGSGSIKQVSFDIISFARNLIAENEVERNTIKMRILKSRYTGLTGNVKGAHYVYDTGRLVGSTADVEEFVTL